MFSTALKVLLFWTLALGVLYPLSVTVLALPFAHAGPLAANVTAPEFFLARPSACDFKAEAACASQLGPTSKALKDKIAERRTANGGGADVPALLLSASGSGLDPDLSPEAALYQVPRIAKARGLSEQVVSQVVKDTIQGPQFGVLGMPRVNVEELNRKLAALSGASPK